MDGWDEVNGERVKMGRVSEAEERLVASLLQRSSKGRRAASRWSSGSAAARLVGQGRMFRCRYIRENRHFSGDPEVVVKAISRAKSAQGIKRMAAYIARQRWGDDPQLSVPVRDEFGDTVAGAVKRKVDGWQLLSDEENFSNGHELIEGTSQQLEERSLRHVQAVHLVFSMPGEVLGDKGMDTLDKAVRHLIDEAFASDGHRVLWCLHDDHSDHPHAHVIVKSASEFGGRLRFDKAGEYLHGLRVAFALRLNALGVPCQATRREDRPLLRVEIMKGEAPLRAGRSYLETVSGPRNLSVLVPKWHSEYGQSVRKRDPTGDRFGFMEKVGRLFRGDVSRPAGVWAQNQNLPQTWRALASTFDAVYQDEGKAFQSWTFMATEGMRSMPDGDSRFPNRSLALWYLSRKPDIFGPLKEAALDGSAHRHLMVLAKAIPLHHVRRDVGASPTMRYLYVIPEEQWRRRVASDRKRLLASLARLHAWQEEIGVPDEVLERYRDVLRAAAKTAIVTYRSGYAFDPYILRRPRKGTAAGTRPLPSASPSHPAAASPYEPTPDVRRNPRTRSGRNFPRFDGGR